MNAGIHEVRAGEVRRVVKMPLGKHIFMGDIMAKWSEHSNFTTKVMGLVSLLNFMSFFSLGEKSFPHC